MRINGENISNDTLAEITEYVKQFADEMQDKPTEFELITAIAFEFFKREGCDVVVLEAGMGGRLDSTNVIKTPLLSVITGIALDHTAFLGDTVPKIAREKAGIIKNGVPVLYGGLDEDAAQVIKEVADARGAAFHRPDYTRIENLRSDLRGTRFDFATIKDVRLNLLGLYQPQNAALAITAAGILSDSGVALSDEHILRGLENASWPARFEILSKEPLVIFDGAHNPQGISAAVESIKLYFADRKVYLLTGVLRDKDYTAIAKDLSSVASKAFTLTPDNPRALTAKEYADVLQSAGISATPSDSIKEAFERAKEAAKNDGIPLICLGSLYVYSSLQ
jgi:dihydrofolate synthase/folylpolyglutamate synthase